MEYININNVRFELEKEINFKPICNKLYITECYKEPSACKRDIYYKWLNWFLEIADSRYIYTFGIQSFNNYMFTLSMIIKYNNRLYYLKITPYHNIATPIIFNEEKK